MAETLHPRTGRPVHELKLGKLARRSDPRTKQLAAYVRPGLLPPIPDHWDGTIGITEWPMYGNDRLGDCTCAAVAHMNQRWSHEATGKAVEMPLSDIEDTYAKLNGFASFADMPASAYDNGAVELDVLNLWRGGGIPGTRIEAFVAVAHSNRQQTVAGAYLFGGLYIGVALPLSCQAQLGKTWDVVAGADGAVGSWGGHAVNVIGFDPDGLTVVTWGALQRMTWSFWDKYVDESYAILPADYEVFAETPDAEGFNLAQLRADVADLGSSPASQGRGCNPFSWFQRAA